MTRPEDTSDRSAGSGIGREWKGIGSSMLPFVLPGSRLHLRFADETGLSVQRGEVICYLDTARKIVAHRLVAVREEDGELEYVVKGDAQTWTEQVSPKAVLAAVERVDQPLLSYRTDGVVGRAIAFAAVSAPSLISATAVVAGVMVRIARKVAHG